MGLPSMTGGEPKHPCGVRCGPEKRCRRSLRTEGKVSKLHYKVCTGGGEVGGGRATRRAEFFRLLTHTDTSGRNTLTARVPSRGVVPALDRDAWKACLQHAPHSSEFLTTLMSKIKQRWGKVGLPGKLQKAQLTLHETLVLKTSFLHLERDSDWASTVVMLTRQP